LWRRLALPPRVATWSLTSLQQRLVKTGGRVVKQARGFWVFLGGGELAPRRFVGGVGKVSGLPGAGGGGGGGGGVQTSGAREMGEWRGIFENRPAMGWSGVSARPQ